MIKNILKFKRALICTCICMLILSLAGCATDEMHSETEAAFQTPELDSGAPRTVAETETVAQTEEETVPVAATQIEVTGTVGAEYIFTGRNAERCGYAEGSITLNRLENGRKNGFYHLYFSSGGNILPGYEAIAKVRNRGDEVTVELPQGMLLPPEATEILVFETSGLKLKDSAVPAAVITIDESKRLHTGDSYYSFASVSDVHVNYDSYGATDKWVSALNFFARKGLDAVIVSGDMTGDGLDEEYEKYLAAIEASDFPAERIYESRGNHDSQTNTAFLKYTSGEGEVRPAPDSPYFYILEEASEGHRDNLFIFMAQEITAIANTNLEDNFSDAQLDWLEALLRKYRGTETNIFLVQHSVIHNFGPGDRYDGSYVQPIIFSEEFPNNMRFREILTEYKELIMMSGHTHLSFYDWVNYGDENGTAARMIHNSSTSQPRSYLDDGTISYNANGATTETEGSEGYAVYVYDDCIVYLGYNLTTGDIIPRASFVMDTDVIG